MLQILIFLILISAFSLEGISHGLRDKNKGAAFTLTRSFIWHISNSFYIVMLLLGTILIWFTYDCLEYVQFLDIFKKHSLEIFGNILMIVTIRFCIFDYVRNLAKGDNVFYIGDTSLFDKGLQVINCFLSPFGILMFRLFLLVVVFKMI